MVGYQGEQNAGYPVKDHEKLHWKEVSYATLHFVWGHISKDKQWATGTWEKWAKACYYLARFSAQISTAKVCQKRISVRYSSD